MLSTPAGRWSGSVPCWSWTGAARGAGRRAGVAGPSTTACRAATRSMVCWSGRSLRSWPCSRSGATSTCPTASSPTGAAARVACGCRRRRSIECWPATALFCKANRDALVVVDDDEVPRPRRHSAAVGNLGQRHRDESQRHPPVHGPCARSPSTSADPRPPPARPGSSRCGVTSNARTRP